MSSAGQSSPAQPDYNPPPLSVQQEDAIIHTRITNDEKALRRVTRKFHTYASVAYPPLVPLTPSTSSSVEDARDTFLLELASFQLSLKKSLMVCEAEARQVEEYQRERERIANERSRLKDQIEDLKEALEQAQLERKRKIEYDVIAEKVNTLPTRDELEQSIRSLENDMAAIRAEHENQNRVLHAQKAALDTVIHDINVLRLMGKDEESSAPTPAPETQPGEDVEMDGTSSVRTREESGELREDAISRAASTTGKATEDVHDSDEDIPLSKVVLNPGARAFLPKSRTSSPLVPLTRTTSAAPLREQEEEDIEMGEIGEEPKDVRGRRKMREEELEEGEASDESSELSEPPDD
ncbi:Tho complex subunit 7-domain-containing protein [Trametes gibbosa]|nr:Tho complex subunit 7-domain-containing protein [Trametes gibbosa]